MTVLEILMILSVTVEIGDRSVLLLMS